MVEIIVCPLHPVPGAARIGPTQPFVGGNVEQQRYVRHQPAGRKAIGSADFLFGQSATEDLVGVGRKKKPVYQDNQPFDGRWEDFSCNKLGARGHEEQRLGRRGDFLFGMKEDFSNVVADWRPARLAHGDARNAGAGEALGKETYLSRLARALSPLQNYEPPPTHFRKA